jgi:alkylated DNA repair dioxygenase AlkB
VLTKQRSLFGLDPPLPEGLGYMPEFIDAEQENELLARMPSLPLREARYKGYIANRRTLSYGSGYDFETNVLTPASPVPEFLFPLRDQVARWLDLPAERFSHALLTEYRPGTALGWHRDVPDFDVVVGVSLASSCRMRFRPFPPESGKRQDVFALELEPRSVYVLRGSVRWRWQHSVPATKGLRYSITFRTPRP